jgi:hypothetical protein
LKQTSDRVARRYNAVRREAAFKVGDFVLVQLHPLESKVVKCSAKIENKWSDPLCIAEFLAK